MTAPARVRMLLLQRDCSCACAHGAVQVEWWLAEHFGGPTALGHKDVDGLILDDFWRR